MYSMFLKTYQTAKLYSQGMRHLQYGAWNESNDLNVHLLLYTVIIPSVKLFPSQYSKPS